jgi:hypothetical protein
MKLVLPLLFGLDGGILREPDRGYVCRADETAVIPEEEADRRRRSGRA